jgi:glyoxylase-like metal-dependent hydrolase (beta-lactamase superfamily II)
MDPVRRLCTERPDFFSVRPAHAAAAQPVTNRIWLSPGLSNAYMVLTSAGRVIVNTGMGFEAPVHKRVFDAVCPGPTPCIVLTQGHVDHVGGVGLFREPGTQLIAQHRLPECQRDDERIKTVRQAQAAVWFREVFAAAADTGPARPAFVQDVPRADVEFDDAHAFEVGDTRFELYATPGGETVDSCVVWLPQTRILFSGNLFGPLFPHFPNFNTIRGDRYRQVEPYLQSLRRVRALAPETLITGHFEPIVGAALIRSCLDRLEAAVDFVHRETLAGMNRGQDIWTLMRTIVLPEALYVGQGYGKVSWAVRTIWETYMGWFKSQSTSELYPTQPREIHADLVGLAGIDAVLARGRQKLQDGDPEAALLFAEAALAADSRDAGALRLSLDAHRALLERSGAANFWETGWLRDQIARQQLALETRYGGSPS